MRKVLTIDFINYCVKLHRSVKHFGREGYLFVCAMFGVNTVQSAFHIAQAIWHTAQSTPVQCAYWSQTFISKESAHDNTARMSSTEDVIMAIPRELTQNPLRKIWIPCKNGLPEKHISQKRGWFTKSALLALFTNYHCVCICLTLEFALVFFSRPYLY